MEKGLNFDFSKADYQFDLQQFAEEPPVIPGSGPVVPPEDKPLTMADVELKIKEATEATRKALEEQHKKDLAGRDKAYTDLKKKADDLELKGKTAEEQAAIQARKDREEAENKEKLIQKRESDFFKLQKAASLKLPSEMLPAEIVDFLPGSTEDEIQANTVKFNALLEKAFQAGVKSVIDKVNTEPSKSTGGEGKTPLATLEAQLKALEEKMNPTVADTQNKMRLTRLIQEEKKKEKK
jgi:hypothetical protein